jgi:hypothetical protein
MKIFILLLIAGLFSSAVTADTAGYSGKPDKLITSAKDYGYCMARFPTMNVTLAGCDPTYVSFACEGDMPGVSKTSALAAWSAVQLAYVTDQELFVVVDNTLTYNLKYCVATRTDNNK